jgi:hypothetical protein
MRRKAPVEEGTITWWWWTVSLLPHIYPAAGASVGLLYMWPSIFLQ